MASAHQLIDNLPNHLSLPQVRGSNRSSSSCKCLVIVCAICANSHGHLASRLCPAGVCTIGANTIRWCIRLHLQQDNVVDVVICFLKVPHACNTSVARGLSTPSSHPTCLNRVCVLFAQPVIRCIGILVVGTKGFKSSSSGLASAGTDCNSPRRSEPIRFPCNSCAVPSGHTHGLPNQRRTFPIRLCA